MDDTSKHDSSYDEDIIDEPDYDGGDEGDDTPADTGDGEPKTPGQQAMERQKEAWLKKLERGDKTLDDMPKNLKWLKEDPDFDKFRGKKSKKTVEEDELDRRVQEVLRKEREKEEHEFLLDDVAENATQEQSALFQEEYDSLVEDGIPELKAAVLARRLAGLKDRSSALQERRLKGRILPPDGSRRRDTVIKKDVTSDVERKFLDNLPPGFKA